MNLAQKIKKLEVASSRYDSSPAQRAKRRLASAMFRAVYRSAESPIQDHYLAIEWAIQEFWAQEIRHHIPAFVAVYRVLAEKKYTHRKPFVWNDWDNSAYLFRSRHAEYQTFVIESQSLRRYYYLKLNASQPWHQEIHVRSKKDSLEYRDCRDKGFLFSLDCFAYDRPGKADNAHACWSETYWAVWHVLLAYKELQEAARA